MAELSLTVPRSSKQKEVDLFFDFKEKWFARFSTAHTTFIVEILYMTVNY